ncbi:Tm-1-like ATP-binding domain-containing protein [Aspergillus melleus]|uniref:Tm-1-like ATP-binding domain-containing protein n=1 Tax=Aspergillus melleus TaxID=138277 RepID=UPI001E8CDF03|nr:uncharacterized protein LDX57_003578 [Aspergillus melleus]KAH8425834.1 hypothetical protein LDX57_003578 [Aspergillus melleus]
MWLAFTSTKRKKGPEPRTTSWQTIHAPSFSSLQPHTIFLSLSCTFYTYCYSRFAILAEIQSTSISKMPQPTILLVGTLDSKSPELHYTRRQIERLNACNVLILDVGRTQSNTSDTRTSNNNIINNNPSTSTPQILTPTTTTPLNTLPRAEYITTISHAAVRKATELYRAGHIHGIIGIGGSCGTNIATSVMREALPVGFPKLMVSTMASGDVRRFVEGTDISMMYSVVDIAGTNTILNRILRNAAAAISGMVAGSWANVDEEEDEETVQGKGAGKKNKVKVGITMFGVTTPCVDRVREYLESAEQQQQSGYEVYVFHATGAGGKAMERLVKEKQLDAVIDMTTTEVVDELVGGVLSAGPSRLEAAAEAGIPQLVSVGACDMVNFGPREELPTKFADRRIYEHNPTVTIVRTTVEENRRVARWIADKLKRAKRPDRVRVLLPTGGVSLLDTPDQLFHDPAADEMLFSTLETELQGTGIAVVRDARAINEEDFAVTAAQSFVQLIADTLQQA